MHHHTKKYETRILRRELLIPTIIFIHRRHTTRFLDDDGVPFVTEYLSVRIFFMRGGGNKRRIIVLFLVDFCVKIESAFKFPHSLPG